MSTVRFKSTWNKNNALSYWMWQLTCYHDSMCSLGNAAWGLLISHSQFEWNRNRKMKEFDFAYFYFNCMQLPIKIIEERYIFLVACKVLTFSSYLAYLFGRLKIYGCVLFKIETMTWMNSVEINSSRGKVKIFVSIWCCSKYWTLVVPVEMGGKLLDICRKCTNWLEII